MITTSLSFLLAYSLEWAISPNSNGKFDMFKFTFGMLTFALGIICLVKVNQ